MAVKTAVERNFRRAKVKPSKKRAGRARVLLRALRPVAVMVLALVAGYLALDLVVSASTLQIRKITIKGNSRLSVGEVQALVEGLRGTSILTADLPLYRQQLLESPWVADAAMRRILPSTVEIFISERAPIGLCRLGSDLYLLDRTGILIDEFGPKYASFDLPLIDGVVRRPAGANPVIDERRTALAASVIDAVAPHKTLAARLSQIDVTALDDAVVLLDDDAAFLHLGTDRFVERLKTYLEIKPALRERVADMDYVDLRFGDRVYVRAAGGKTPQEVPARPQGTSGRRKD
jgi:cell division septal protein FtsQ